MGRSGRHPKLYSSFADAQTSRPIEHVLGYLPLGASQLSPLRSGPHKSGLHPLNDAPAFELRNRPENVHLELAGRRRGVDPFRQRHERNAERLEIFQQRGQMLQVATKPIQVEITIYMTIN